MAQGTPLYNNFPPQLQSRNLPAGSVMDPGSQLFYIIDTGINLREAVGANLTAYNSPLSEVNQGPQDGSGNFIAPNPFGIGGERSIYNADGTVDPTRINTSFVTITNTHPNQAVTIHFRYFNDECIDLIDFLVVLTCNDTLIFNPFDYVIPATDFNTRNRIFGPGPGVLPPIRASSFASGRFLIFATASGTSFEPQNAGVHDDNAELRFPAEFAHLIDANSDCENLQDDTYFGLQTGIRENNLNVLNASAVAFNYLIGSWTTAVTGGEGSPAYGINAWTRPAVDLTGDDLDNDSLRSEPDGDGPPLVADQAVGGNDFRILTGREIVVAANGTSQVASNDLYLRNEAHGGDTANVNDIDGNLADDYDSWYGALGVTSLFGTDPEEQRIHFVSIVDDYNGSRHILDTPVAGFVDRSYGLVGAETTYVLQIYDNNETLFDIEDEAPLNISPAPQQVISTLKITVDCLRTWITDQKLAALSVDDLQLSDLDGLAEGLLDFLTQQVDPTSDASQGWIRFVRDNSIFDSNSVARLYGTSARANLINDSADEASFLTIGLQTMRFGGYQTGWWLSTAASNPDVSDTGDPQCNGGCPAKTP